jgi:hypothetical protein
MQRFSNYATIGNTCSLVAILKNQTCIEGQTLTINMNYELRPFWSRFFVFDCKFGLFLILIVCIPRFILVLNANASGNYGSIGLIMIISAIAPFIFLNRQGQKKIGITKPFKYSWLLIAFVSGLISCYTCHTEVIEPSSQGITKEVVNERK